MQKANMKSEPSHTAKTERPATPALPRPRPRPSAPPKPPRFKYEYHDYDYAGVSAKFSMPSESKLMLPPKNAQPNPTTTTIKLNTKPKCTSTKTLPAVPTTTITTTTTTTKRAKKPKHLHFQSPLVKPRSSRTQHISHTKNSQKKNASSSIRQPPMHMAYATLEHNNKNYLHSSCGSRNGVEQNVGNRNATVVTTASNAASAAATNKNRNRFRKTKTKTKTIRNIAYSSNTAFGISSLPSAYANGTHSGIGSGSKVKNRLAHGCTSLMYACQHGDIAEIFNQLHSKPESIHQRDSRNKNALHYCAVAGSIAAVDKRDLVAAASIAVAAPELLESADEDGFTPLHLAVIQGNLAMVNLLLANKADVNAVDNEGHSVVHWATVCGEVEALRAVLAAGANVAIPDINGGTPLHYAAQMCGASYEGKLGQANSTKLAMDILNILIGHPHCSVDVQDKDGRQALLWAASAGSAKAVIALVKAGARVESADKDGLTALHCAASRGHTDCIDTLISLCGAPTDLIDANGCTALHYAVTLGHADATSRLLDLEADPNRQDRKGRTPAHCGCSKGQFETVKLLKERGANLWLRNAKGDLPLHEAAASGRRELVEWLLEQRRKQVNTTSNDGRSMLHIAAANDYTDLCKLLLDFGGDVNALYRNSKGVVITPIDCALHKGHRSTAKFLQSNGGLPASKLRMAARRPNPVQDATADIVRPLKYAEKEEIHDLRSSRKYVVYSKRSDSEGGGDGSCSCTEQTYRKEERVEHMCKRHQRRQLRRRTSSCGEPKDICQRKECSGMCRSKSNIEIRRRKSRERYASSSDWEDDEDDMDSCENCCYHKREKQRVIRRRHSSSSKRFKSSKDSKDSDNDSKREKRHQEKRIKPKEEGESVADKEKPIQTVSRPSSMTTSRPQSASRRRTPPSSGKDGTFIKSSPPSARTVDGSDGKSLSTNAMEFTDEEGAGKAAEVLTTQVDVHREADEVSLQTANETAEDKEEDDGTADKAAEGEDITELSTEITEMVERDVDQLLNIAVAAIESESAVDAEIKDDEQEIVKPTDDAETAMEAVKVGAESEAATEENLDKLMTVPSMIEIPATPMPTPVPTPVPTPLPSPPPTATTETTSPAPQTADNEVANKTEIEDEKQGKDMEATSSATEAIAKETPVEASSAEAAPIAAVQAGSIEEAPAQPDDTAADATLQREQESRRSFTLLPSDSADDEVEVEVEAEAEAEPDASVRKSSFQVLKSDESMLEEHAHSGDVELSDSQGFKIIDDIKPLTKAEISSAEDDAHYSDDDDAVKAVGSTSRKVKSKGIRNDARSSTGNIAAAATATSGIYDYTNGRKRRLKKRVRSGAKTRSNWKNAQEAREQVGTSGGADDVGVGVAAQNSKDQDSGFEPSPRTMKTKIPTPRNIYTAYVPRRQPIYATLDGRSCSSRFENRKPGDRGACDMTAVTRSIQRNIRRYYMERKIFQHLLELKSLQIRSSKLNEAVLVKRAVDDYHKSCASLGGETGTRLRRYNFSEYTFKNFELFLYETLKALQKPGTYNFQNINEVYEEAERRLSPDYNAYTKALQCTIKTHRCLHAAHAYTGIPCAAYIPMMNHHTMPKFGFGSYKKTGVGSFYLPKILTSSAGCGGKVALELSHGKSKQLISLPSEKLDSNKRYYVTFTVKESGGAGAGAGAAGCNTKPANATEKQTGNDAGAAAAD